MSSEAPVPHKFYPKPTPVIPRKEPKKLSGFLNPEQLTNFEKTLLKNLGWNGKDQVPLDLYNRLQNKQIEVKLPTDPAEREAYLAKLQNEYENSTSSLPAEFLARRSKGISDDFDAGNIQVTQLDQIPPEIMRKYAEVEKATAIQPGPTQVSQTPNLFNVAMQSALAEQKVAEQNAGLTPAIAEAVRSVEKELNSEIPASKEEDEEDNRPVVTEPKKEKSYQEARKEYLKKLASSLNREDIDNYIDCVISNTGFFKTYKIFGNSLEITLRQVTQEDRDEIMRQYSIDLMNNRNREQVEQAQLMVKYEMVFQIVKIVNLRKKETLLEVPGHKSCTEYLAKLFAKYKNDSFAENDTVVRKYYLWVTREALSLPVWNAVVVAINEFKQLLDNLEQFTTEPDFFELLGQPT